MVLQVFIAVSLQRDLPANPNQAACGRLLFRG
jgi:hypothetical protein